MQRGRQKGRQRGRQIARPTDTLTHSHTPTNKFELLPEGIIDIIGPQESPFSNGFSTARYACLSRHLHTSIKRHQRDLNHRHSFYSVIHLQKGVYFSPARTKKVRPVLQVSMLSELAEFLNCLLNLTHTRIKTQTPKEN